MIDIISGSTRGTLDVGITIGKFVVGCVGGWVGTVGYGVGGIKVVEGEARLGIAGIGLGLGARG